MKEEYFELALEYASANEAAFDSPQVKKTVVAKNVERSNKIRAKLDVLCKQAKDNGSLSVIEEYMDHENKYVRCLTAMYCLFTNPSKAEKVLKDILELPTPNPAGMQAFTILEVWRKGLMVL